MGERDTIERLRSMYTEVSRPSLCRRFGAAETAVTATVETIDNDAPPPLPSELLAD